MEMSLDDGMCQVWRSARSQTATSVAADAAYVLAITADPRAGGKGSAILGPIRGRAARTGQPADPMIGDQRWVRNEWRLKLIEPPPWLSIWPPLICIPEWAPWARFP